MDFITAFFGRFHPLLVHLPIGILFLAFLFECLSFKERYKGLRKAVQPSLFWGSVFAIAAAISGYFLRQEGGYEEDIADLHQNSGIITAVLSLVVYVLRPKVKYWFDKRSRKKQVKLLLSGLLILSLIITGHWGGSLTHGEDYLFAAMSLGATADKDPVEKIRTIPEIRQAILYSDVIQPIFEARCYDCHSSRKQKGDLRLDKEEYIARGGENGFVISDGPADSSLLFKRLVLPLEHEDHMPPNEKPQLSSSEIALVKYWIEEKGDFSKRVAEFVSDEKITAIIKAMQQPPQKSWIPAESVKAANAKALQRLNDLGINPMPLTEATNHLMVTLTGQKTITDEQLNGLQQIEEQLVWLNLSHSGITDQQMNALSQLSNLRALYLNNTSISDTGLSRLLPLGELRWLSLVGTGATDESVATFVKMKNLSNLFLYQTGLTEAGIRRIAEVHKEIKIDTGNYMLEELPTDTIVYKRVTSNN